MTLKLRKMGCDFMEEKDRHVSDCGNYRLRAEFTDKNGKHVIADFSGGRIWNDLCVDASYYDENGICHPYSPLEQAVNYTYGKYWRYRLKTIMHAVNSVSAEQYDDVEVIE